MSGIDWTEATCREAEPHLWFPTGYNTAQNERDAAEAKRICHTCALERVCLDRAMADEHGERIDNRHGIWGGLDEHERYTLSRRPVGGLTGRAVQPCGTRGAYRRHLRANETCDVCRPHPYAKKVAA